MILHLVSFADWEAAPKDKPYVPRGYANDGFVHCSGDDQTLLDVANRFYKSQAGEFVVLHIDESRLNAPLKWEAAVDPVSRSDTQVEVLRHEDLKHDSTPMLPDELGDAHIAAYTGYGTRSIQLPASEHPNVVPDATDIQPVAAEVKLFPHVYGPINRESIIGLRRISRQEAGGFTGFMPMEVPLPERDLKISVKAKEPVDVPNPLGLKRPSQLATELLDATDGVSEALKRLLDRTEAHLTELDEQIKKL